MIRQFFGSKKSPRQVYSKASVRPQDNRQACAKVESPIEFEVDACRALNVPTLTPEVTDPPEVQDKAYIKQLVRKRLAALHGMTSGPSSENLVAKLNPDLISRKVEKSRQEQREKHSVIPILKNVVKLPSDHPQGSAKKRVNGKKIVGIFSDSPCFSDQFLRRSFKECPNITFERFSEYDLKTRQREIARVEAWVINLSEEDEHDFLDDFVEKIGNLPTLFLFERSASEKCVENVLQFVAGSRIKSYG